MNGSVKRGNGGPVTIETRVGWVLSGPILFPSPSADIEETYVYIVDTISEQSDLEADLKQFWELESIGITPAKETVHSRMVKEIIFRNG